MASISNLNRMAGLMSGLDTEALIKAMTANTKARIDSQKQKLQTLQWKQEAYRSVISKISDFKDKYLNILSPTSIKAQAIMNKYVASSSNEKRITATAASGATPGTYTISSATTATAAKVYSGSVTSGKIELDFSNAKSGKSYSVEMNLDGVTKTVKFTGGEDLDETRQNFLDAANEAFSGIIGSAQGFEFDGEGSSTLTFNNAGDGVTHTFAVAKSTAVGLKETAYNQISTSYTLGSISFKNALKSDDGKYNITINGVDFEFDEDTTIADMISTINNSDAGVKLSFSNVSQSFTLETKETGAASEISMSQTHGNLLNALFNLEGSAANVSPTEADRGQYIFNGNKTTAYFDTEGDFFEALRKGLTDDVEEGTYVLNIVIDGKEVSLDLTEYLKKELPRTKEDGEYSWSATLVTESLKNAIGAAYYNDAVKADSTLPKDLSVEWGEDGEIIFNTATSSIDVSIDVNNTSLGLKNVTSFDKSDETFIAGGAYVVAANKGDELATMTFKVNGEDVTITAAEGSEGITLNDLVKKGIIKMDDDGYIRVADGITLEASGEGDSFSAANDFLTTVFGSEKTVYTGRFAGEAYTVNGTNSRITISTDGENFTTYTSSSNLFTFDGTTIDISKAGEFDASGDPDNYITIEVTKDTSGIMDVIKGFVEDYNTLIADLYGEVSTSRPKSKGEYYDPLTDDEEEEMSEKEIEKWNEQAKTGLLYNDRNVLNFLSSLRSAMSTYVDGFGLADMGITLTNDWQDNGKLEINESKLESAINAYGDKVTDFFTKASEGLSAKLENVVDRAISTNSTGYGYLSSLAGIEGTRTNTDNQIYRQMQSIQDLIDRLNEKYEKEQSRYWTKFTALETYMAKMQAQMSYFTDNSTSSY